MRADGTPIPADGQSYSITTIDYLINGGDGYGNVFSRASSVMGEPYLDAIIDAFTTDLAAGRTTRVPPIDGRIRNLATQP